MLERKATEELNIWAKQSKKKCLLVRGARQIGKTTSVREFGQQYRSFIEINFLRTPSLKAIFSENLDVDTLLFNFSVYLPGAAFLPGETLLFLDEIQECPQAITSLKFWCEDGRFDVIASGSLLGLDHGRPQSYPVGFLSYLDMAPLSFEEFLWANGISDSVIRKLRQHFDSFVKVPDALNDRMMQYLRLYMAVGGMPEAVTAYLKEESLSTCYETQQNILQDYRYDIAHYASPDLKMKAESCYFSLPEQLSKENRKFRYSVVEKGGNARKYATSLDFLLGADLVLQSFNVSRMTTPLRNYKVENNFRLYAGDIGLLTAMYDYSVKAAIVKDTFDKTAGYVRGGLYEALVADLLTKTKHRALYFRKPEQGTFELEFLLEDEVGVVPVEVKAKNSRAKSLDHALEKDEIPYGYKLIDGNVGKSGKKITLPLYMAMFL